MAHHEREYEDEDAATSAVGGSGNEGTAPASPQDPAVPAPGAERALPPPAALALRSLSVFPGADFTALCAAALLGHPAEQAGEVLDVLLEARCLASTGPGRFRLLEPHFAPARIPGGEHEGEAERAALIRVTRWYLASIDAAGQATETLRPSVADPSLDGPEPESIADRGSAAAWYRAEHANLLPLMHAAANAGLNDETWRIAVGLGPLHSIAGSLQTWLQAAQIGLAAAQAAGDAGGEGRVLLTLATAYSLDGRPDAAAEALENALSIFTAAADLPGMIDAENRLGLLLRDLRDLAGAQVRFRRVLDLAHGERPLIWQALAWENLAEAAQTGGHGADAEQFADRAASLYEQAGAEPHMRVGPLLVLARVHREAGRLEQAGQDTERATKILTDGAVSNRWLEYAVGIERGHGHLTAGQSEQALEEFRRCAELTLELGNRPREARAATALATATLAAGRPEQASDIATTAAELARAHATGYDTAAALDVLAQALAAQDEHAAATQIYAQAADLLTTYPDPTATALRTRLLAAR